MVPARKVRGLGRTATVKGGRSLMLESENASTASPVKQLPVNVIPDDWMDQQQQDNPPSGPVPPFLVYPGSDLGVDTVLKPAPQLEIFTTPPQNFPDKVSDPAQYTPVYQDLNPRRQSPIRVTHASDVYTTQPVDQVSPSPMIYPAPPPVKGQLPAPVTILPNSPQTTAISTPAPGATTGNGLPAPATITTVPNALIPQAVSGQQSTVDLFGYQIPTSYLLIGGALLVFWLMDTHKAGGRR